MKTILTLAVFSIAFGASAQTAVSWGFNSTLAGSPASHISASAVSLGSSIVSNSFNGSTEFYGQDGWPAGAIDANAYLQFTVSPSTGYTLVLNSVAMTVRRSNTGSPSGAGPTSWALRSSLDGYTTDLATNSMTYNYATYTVTLPAVFQNLTGAVSFRLYGYNTTINSGGTSRFVYDNISIAGQAISGLLAEQSIVLSARPTTGAVSLRWQTFGIAPGTSFAVERSVDGVNFEAIDRVNATDAISYQYNDIAVPVTDRVFYRVLAEQSGGSSVLSPTSVVTPGVSVTGTGIRGVAASGGIVRTFLHLTSGGVYQLSIWSRDGRALYHRVLDAQAGDQIADIAAGGCPHGVYVVTVAKEGMTSSRQFIF
ncbi:MAG: hypothetical protein JST42_23420 [Bacteroidetes bacterium]|nr:hypothetical protein [Bacteroidota bacterium]